MDEVERLVERLIEQLKSEDARARINATLKLRELKDKRAVSGLIEALKDEDVRGNAIWALGELGEPAVPALIEALEDEEDRVRKGAAEALGHIGDASAVPHLIEALEDEDKYVRAHAALALEDIVMECKTIEDLERAERLLDECSAALRKGRPDKTMLINAQIDIAKLTREIAKKKDKLAPKRDLLLDDKPKPPKRGRGVYHTTRMIRNG